MRLLDLLEHLQQQAIKADLEMQLLQRQAWAAADLPATTGFERDRFLLISDLKLSFTVLPTLSFWQRLWWCWRYVWGDRLPCAYDYRLGTNASDRATAFNVSITLERNPNGQFSVKCEPPATELGEVYVADLVSGRLETVR